MLGLMLSNKETQEFEYMLKRELEEILLDLTDSRIDGMVKSAMEERYKIIFGLYKRFASPKECYKYIRTKKEHSK